MRITQRQVVIGLQFVMLVGLILILLYQIMSGTAVERVLITAAGALTVGIVLLLYWWGWRYAHSALLVISVIVPALVPPDPRLNRETVLSLLIPPIFALIMGRPLWVLLVAVATPLVLVARAGGTDLDLGAPVVVLYCMVVGGMALARLVMDNVQRDVEQNARRAEEEQARAEQQAGALAAANEQMTAQLDQQRQLLDLVTTLETPAVPLAEGVLFAPLIGHVDSRRSQALTSRLLAEASARRARLVILDIAGVPVMDTTTARGLVHTAQSLRLLGCRVTISGISAGVAMTLVQLGVGLEGITTVRSPQEALAQHFDRAPLNGQSNESP